MRKKESDRTKAWENRALKNTMKNIYRIYYKMNFMYPDLDKVNHLIFLQDKTPFEKYPEIVDNILHSQFLEFAERKKNEL